MSGRDKFSGALARQAEQQRMIKIAADYERLRVLAKQKSQLSAALQSAIEQCTGLSKKVKDANAQIDALTPRQRDMRAWKNGDTHINPCVTARESTLAMKMVMGFMKSM